jgi:phosphoglycolate phosphatase-like HAD superfamily hydrolase
VKPDASNPLWATADAYLFDIDGTVLNSRDGVHYYAFHHAVQNVFGVSSHIDGVPVHGNTDIGILRAVARREGVSDAEFEAHLPEVMTQMCREVRANASAIRAELCPSIRELLERLHSSGKLLGIVSGNLEPIAWTKLEAAGVRPFFIFGCFSDRNELREDIFRAGIAETKRRLGPAASACVVGDTPSDICAARAVGVPVIAVATGIFTLDQLREADPDVCVSCCTDLLPSFQCGITG